MAADDMATLHAATLDMPLSLFLVLAEDATAWGGQTTPEIATAAAFCDALLAARRSAGLPGRSVTLGPWATRDQAVTRTDIPGIRMLSRERTYALLDAALRSDRPGTVLVDVDSRALAARPARDLPAVLRALGATAAKRRQAARPAAGAADRPADWASRLTGLSPTERHRLVLDLVRRHAAAVLGQASPEALRVDVSFKDLGFDSVAAVELRDRLVAASGLRLPAAVVFRHPTLEALAKRIGQDLASGTQASDNPASGTQASGNPPADGAARTGSPAAAPRTADATAAGNAVLADLHRLEQTLAGGIPEGTDTDAVTARLEAALTKWRAATSAARVLDTAEKLRTATAHDLLAYIDNELGVPSGASAPPR
jgi:acyl carrier protein